MTEPLIALVFIIFAILVGHWLQRREDRRYHSTSLITTISAAGFEQPKRIAAAAMDAMRRIPKENGTLPPAGKNT